MAGAVRAQSTQSGLGVTMCVNLPAVCCCLASQHEEAVRVDYSLYIHLRNTAETLCWLQIACSGCLLASPKTAAVCVGLSLGGLSSSSSPPIMADCASLTPFSAWRS